MEGHCCSYPAALSPGPHGSAGQLLVKGGNLFSEYWGREQATREALTPDGWFKTGDSGEAVPVPAGSGAAGSGEVPDAASTGDEAAGGSDGIPECYRILGRTRWDEGSDDVQAVNVVLMWCF